VVRGEAAWDGGGGVVGGVCGVVERRACSEVVGVDE
jgi:hypothetical protein